LRREKDTLTRGRALSAEDYTVVITVDNSPEEVFAAINDVGAWWDGQIEGTTDRVGSVFTYQYDDFHRSKQKVTELTPGKRVVWDIIEGGPKFVKDKSEWKGTRVIFEITRKGGKTEVRFTHHGLIPRLECYDSCTDAWGPIIRNSLRSLITTGKRVTD
jgi:hypothetical protein